MTIRELAEKEYPFKANQPKVTTIELRTAFVKGSIVTVEKCTKVLQNISVKKTT